MKFKTKKLMGSFLVVLSIFLLVGCVPDDQTDPVDDTPSINPEGETEITDEVFLEVLNDIMENHYTQPTYEQLMEGAINGMFDALDDPHSSYFDYEEYNSFQSGFEETYVGIGVTVSFTNDQIIVESVKDDGPAEDAGILPNDIITSVDGVSTIGEGFYDVINTVLGEEGTDVTIGLSRTGVEHEILLTMTRAVINNSSVNFTSYSQGGQTIGYIEVTQFGDETADKFSEAIALLELQNIDGMVVDLRNNGGGHLTTVLSMLDEFLVSSNDPMFSTAYYVNGELLEQDYFASGYTPKDYDIVTLVNENSASASEVFASAMQEQGGYPVIGNVTYGKGTMQTDLVVTATVGDRLHLSIGQWFTSDGNWVHFNGGSDGVTPDILVDRSIYEKAYKLFLIDEDPLVYDTVDDRIANVQLVLETMGFVVRTDGYFDVNTKAAILTIQNQNDLPLTGDMDSATLLVINEALDAYKDNANNDTQLISAINYLTGAND